MEAISISGPLPARSGPVQGNQHRPSMDAGLTENKEARDRHGQGADRGLVVQQQDCREREQGRALRPFAGDNVPFLLGICPFRMARAGFASCLESSAQIEHLNRRRQTEHELESEAGTPLILSSSMDEDQIMARKKNEPRGTFIKIGGIPVDLNAGMIEAVTDPPPSFVSKHRFVETDLPRRIQAINWFANCGRPFTLDLTMPIRQVKNWSQTIKPCTSPRWDDAQLEAQNRLTLWLHLHDRARYRKWNGIVEEHKKKVIHPMLGMAGPDVALKP